MSTPVFPKAFFIKLILVCSAILLLAVGIGLLTQGSGRGNSSSLYVVEDAPVTKTK